MNYESMGVYELREYARQVGVRSPTTKTREKLITEIEAIKNGEKLKNNPSTRGRPPKRVYLYNNKDSYCQNCKRREVSLLKAEMLIKKALALLSKN